MVKDKSYREQAESDALSTLEEFLDQMVEQWKDGEEISNDLNNDYPNGDAYHHESHVERDYRLTDAANILDELSEYEETDNGLWEGLEPRRAIAAQAAFAYGNAVYNMWRDHVDHMNEELSSLEFDSEEEKAWFGGLYITAYTRLLNSYGWDDCQGMIHGAIRGLERGETAPLAILLDYIEEKEPPHKQGIVKTLRRILSEKPAEESEEEKEGSEE